MRICRTPIPFLLLLTAPLVAAAEKELTPVNPGAVRREPVAAVFLDDQTAAIACAKSGTLMIWDVNRGEMRHEYAVGKQLRGVARFGENELLVIDEKAHQLIQLRYADGRMTELQREEVPAHPVCLVAWETRAESLAAVASLWSRQITIWHKRFGELRKRGLPIELPFEPRLVVPESHNSGSSLVALPAFGGEALIVRPATSVGKEWGDQAVTSQYAGIAIHQYMPFATRQTLNQTLPLTLEYVAHGNIMQNEIMFGGQQIALARVNDQGATVNDQIADPAGIAFVKDKILVCLAGTDQVWYRSSTEDDHPKRLSVGKRPRTIISNDEIALVLGELDDTVSRIEFKNPEQPAVTTRVLDPLAVDRELSPAERGERLFFSGKMSAGGMMSCHSCHTDGHTNGLLADTLGDNTHGTPKRILTLRGTRLTDLWAWNGEMKTLQDNVHKSLRETMHAPEIKPADVDDLVSFLHTLPPVPPLKPAPKDAADAAQVARGEKIFQRENCTTCHVPPLTFTSHAVYDVGMADEKGLRKFNPPSLRGVGRLRKLFHDNRASSLRDVFETHGHQLEKPLPEGELADLVRYLESL